MKEREEVNDDLRGRFEQWLKASPKAPPGLPPVMNDDRYEGRLVGLSSAILALFVASLVVGAASHNGGYVPVNSLLVALMMVALSYPFGVRLYESVLRQARYSQALKDTGWDAYHTELRHWLLDGYQCFGGYARYSVALEKYRLMATLEGVELDEASAPG